MPQNVMPLGALGVGEVVVFLFSALYKGAAVSFRGFMRLVPIFGVCLCLYEVSCSLGGVVAVGGERCKVLSLTFASYLTIRTRGGGRGASGPGIVFVCTSSLKCNSLRYCKTGGMRAPGIGHLTSRKVQFVGTRTATTADAPSECSVLAKRCT